MVSGTATISLTAGVPFTVTLEANPASLPVGNTSALTATVYDEYHNLVADGTTVTFASDIGTALSQSLTTNGVATSSITSTVAGTALITATSGTASDTAAVLFTLGEPYTVTLEPNPASLTVGSTSVLTATVYDQYGNPVTDTATVTFTSDLGTPLSPRLTTNGVATSSITSTVAGTAVITAASGTVSDTAAVLFTLGEPYTVTLDANPASLTVGNTSVLTATVVDESNNPVADATIVTFTSNLGTVLSPSLTTNGIATSSITSTLPGTAVIIAASGTASDTAAVVFTPGAPFTVTLQANPTSRPVGSTSALTATVVDQYNNPVANATTVTFTSNLGTVLSPRTTTNGIATSSISSTLAGTAVITAASGTASDTAAVVFTPGAPFTVTLQANPASRPVGSTSVLTATVVDQYNNPVANATTVTFTSNLGTVLSPRTTTNGIATSSISSTLAGTAVITAASGTASDTAAVVFTPGAPFTVTLQANPASRPVGSTSALTATVVDQYNNPVANATTVTFTSNLGTVLSPRTTTNGVATSSISSTLAGTAVITAASGTASDTAAVVFTPGAPFTVTLQANPASRPVGSTSVLTATVVDQYNNPVANATTVTFTSNLGTVLSPRTTTNGVATSSISSTLAGTAVITAASGTASDTASVVFTPGAPFTVTLQANPASRPVGSTSALTATVVDRYNNPVANATTVTFTSNIGTVLSPRTTTNGIATSSISSTLAGTAVITATSGTASDTAAVVFTPGAPYTVTLAAKPISLTVGSTSVLTATVVDQYNNPVANATTVTFTSNLGTVLFTAHDDQRRRHFVDQFHLGPHSSHHGHQRRSLGLRVSHI